jgi:hypothetical protein
MVTEKETRERAIRKKRQPRKEHEKWVAPEKTRFKEYA